MQFVFISLLVQILKLEFHNSGYKWVRPTAHLRTITFRKLFRRQSGNACQNAHHIRFYLYNLSKKINLK